MHSMLFRWLIVAGFMCSAGCVSLPPEALQPNPASSALDVSVDTALGKTLRPIAAAHSGDSGFRLLSVGIEGLTARIEMIGAAQRTLDLQYYIFRGDESGNLVAEALLKAADRGVRVRLLVDDADTVPGDEKILSLTARSGIEVRIFNPLRYRGHNGALRAGEFLFNKSRLDYRMHNKLLVVDNAAAIIGGRNIGNQYFQIDPESQFGDDDVVVAGPMVQKLSSVFDQFWNSDVAIPAKAVDKKHTSERALADYAAQLALYRQRLDATRASSAPPAEAVPAGSGRGDDAHLAAQSAEKTPFADILAKRTPLLWSPAKLAYDSPDKKDVDKGNAHGRLIYKAIEEQAGAVKTELLMVTPYFIPSPDELALLQSERDRNASVRILTNSLQAAPNPSAHSGYMHYRVELLQEGVQLHEVRALLGSGKGSGQTQAISRHGNYALHAKLYVFDRKTVFVGSMNFDQRSKHLNTEIGLLIANAEMSREVALRFEALTQLDNSYALSLSDAKPPRVIWTTQEAGTVVRSDIEPARSAWQRFKVKLLALLPLDKEL